ncbi:MAG: SpoIID/LytB domain-containing protein, partial [Acidimicrobiia bacterium]
MRSTVKARMRRVAVFAASATLATGALVVPLGGAVPAQAAPDGDDAVVAFVVRGVGNGHGRGMSQWGSYGRAIAGQSWQDILGAYYSNTVSGTATKPDLRIRLTPWDGVGTLGVISHQNAARWTGSTTSYRSMYAVETAHNQFDVFGANELSCPPGSTLTIPFVDLQRGMNDNPYVEQLQRFLDFYGFGPQPAGSVVVDGDFGPQTEDAVKRFQQGRGLTADGLWRIEEAQAAQAMVNADSDTIGWTKLNTSPVVGPIRFTTTVNQSTAGPADVLGVCEPDGSVTHYRGTVELLSTSVGNRVVNQVDVENYLRGVVPKESPASWGDAAGGKGINALMAQSVAARSYGLSQGRYDYASTCDTPSCQVYGGSAIRVNATTANSVRVEHPNTDAAIEGTAGVVRRWPNNHPTLAGRIVSTEFSASNGPRTAGGSFPAVDDPYDDQPGNPNHRWTRIIDADRLMDRYDLSAADAVRTEPAPPSSNPVLNYDGIWGNRVNLGNGNTISAWDFRNAFGLPAPGFELIPVRRDLTAAGSFAFIGDSVGVSIGGQNAVTQPGSTFGALTEGVFSSLFHDAKGSRPTQGDWFSQGDGVDVAGQVPIGTDLVVVELGYNDTPSQMPERIESMMRTLRTRDVGLVLWVNVSERRTSTDYATTNQALRDAS